MGTQAQSLGAGVLCKLEADMSQNGLLLQFLEEHRGGITQLQAFTELGICRLSERIRELQACGINISHTRVVVPARNGRRAHVMRYTLDHHFALG